MKLNSVAQLALVVAGATSASSVFAAEPVEGGYETPHAVRDASGAFAGAGLGVGVASTTRRDRVGMSLMGRAEQGYQFNLGNGNKLLYSIEAFGGQAGYFLTPAAGQVRTSIPLYGGLAQVGYGMTFANGLTWTIVKGGIGAAGAKIAYDLPQNAGTGRTDTITGLTWKVGSELAIPVSERWDLTTGVSFQQAKFKFSSFRVNGDKELLADSNAMVNLYNAEVGVRYHL